MSNTPKRGYPIPEPDGSIYPQVRDMILAVDADVDALPTDKSQAQLDALNPKPEGVLFYNATTKKMQFFNGTAWIVLGEGSGGSIGVPPGANASWESDTTVTGNPVSAWLSKDGTVTLAQGTGSQRPAVTAGAFGSTQGLTFDGVNDHLTIATKVVTDTSGSAISVVFKTPATVVGPGVLVSQSNVAVANDWFEIGIGADGKLYVENNNAGAKLTIKGSTVLAPSTVYDLMLCYDGTDYFLLLKGGEENPLTIVNIGSFAWFGRVGGTTSFTVGATITSAGVQRPLAGVLGGIYLFDTDLTA